jgi:hypothetical protein
MVTNSPTIIFFSKFRIYKLSSENHHCLDSLFLDALAQRVALQLFFFLIVKFINRIIALFDNNNNGDSDRSNNNGNDNTNNNNNNNIYNRSFILCIFFN